MQQFIRKYLFYVTLLICCVTFSDICMAQKYINYKCQREWVDSIIKSKEGKNLTLEDFLAPTNKIPTDLHPVNEKGIKLYIKGKTDKAYKYFAKIKNEIDRKNKYKKYKHNALPILRGYVNYQLLYYHNFNNFDPYYEGVPTKLLNSDNARYIENYEYDDLTYLMLSSAYGKEYYRPGNVVKYFSPQKEAYSVCDKDNFKHLMLSRTFPKGGNNVELNSGSRYYSSEEPSFSLFCVFHSEYSSYIDLFSYKDKLSALLEGFKTIQNYKYAIPYLTMMSPNSEVYQKDALGKSAKELYEMAQKANEDDEYRLFLLARSSLWGNLDATMELFKFCFNECNSEKTDFIAKRFWNRAKDLCLIMKEMDEYKTIVPLIDQYYQTFDENYNIASENLEKRKRREQECKLAEKEAKRERRRRMWGNILAGVAQAATATMNQMYGGGYAMTPQTYSVPSYSGTIADQMSQPGYFNDVYNQMIQQTMSQAQQQQWNEYQNAQSFFQKMGTNITFEEYQQGLINGFNTVVPQLNVNWNNIDWNNVNWNNIDSQSVDSYDMTTYSGNSPGNSTGTTTSRDILNSNGGGKCLLCHGDGKCFNCHGYGISNNMGITKTCETCKNNRGVCPQCHGTKVASWNR